MSATETLVTQAQVGRLVTDRIRVAPLSELGPGSSVVIHTDVGMVSVYNVDGELHAIDDLCPHMRESLAGGHLDGCIVTCGAHGWRFDVRTGRSPDFDGIQVDTFSVEVEDGIVYLLVAGDPESGMDWEGASDPDDIDDPVFD